MTWTYHIDPDLDPFMTEGYGKVLDMFPVYQAESVHL